MNDHEILIGLHYHDLDIAGIEIACECGSLLHTECDLDAIVPLSEIKIIAEDHRG